jgi:hypothetical protein
MRISAKPFLSFLFLSGALTLMAGAVQGNGRVPPAPVETPIAEMSADHVFVRTLADDTSGFYVIWTSSSASGTQLIAQHFDAVGRALWPAPGAPVSGSLANARDWEAFGGKGGFYVSWIAAKQVLLQRYTPEGHSAWPQPAKPTTAPGGTQTSVVGVDDGATGALVAWTDESGVLSQVWTQRLDASGARLWDSAGVHVTATMGADQVRPVVQNDGGAGLLVAWKAFREEISRVRVQRIDPAGDLLWGDIGLDMATPAGELNQRPLLTSLGTGAAAMAWSDGFAGQNRVWFQQTSPYGKRLWDPAGTLISDVDSEKWNPVLAGDGQGDVWIGWEDRRDNRNYQVYVQQRNALGQPWDLGDVPLAPVGANQGHLNIIDDHRQGLWTAWVDSRFGLPGVGIFFQALDPQGQYRFPLQGVPVATDAVNPERPQLAVLSPQTAAVVWLDQRHKNHWSLYAKVVAVPAP